MAGKGALRRGHSIDSTAGASAPTHRIIATVSNERVRFMWGAGGQW